MSRSELVTAQHLQRKAVIYTLSRDFVGHMLAPHALFDRLRIMQRNRPRTLQQPLKRWQGKRRLCEWLSCQCHKNHEIIRAPEHPTSSPGK